MWRIDKQFSFCYGHRVWSQKLISEYCEEADNQCKCRHLHGHEGLLHVFLKSDSLEKGMVTDFKHLGWLKSFIDENIDHKFILDINDPSFLKISSGSLKGSGTEKYFESIDGVKMPLEEVKSQEVGISVGYKIDTSTLKDELDKELYSGFFLVDFVPTSENLSEWICKVVENKMHQLGVEVAQIDWFETPKSRSTFFPSRA